jgi:hypothetical protein
MFDKRPRYALVFASEGGFEALEKAMVNVYKEIVSRGTLHFVEHKRDEREDRERLKRIGMNLMKGRIKTGMELTEGFYYSPGVRKGDERVKYVDLRMAEKGGILFFGDSCVHIPFNRMFERAMENAWNVGYGDDLLLTFLSGCGFDGYDALGKAKEKGSKVLIQDPCKAKMSQMPNEAIKRAEFTGADYEVLPPEGIGIKISEFMH